MGSVKIGFIGAGNMAGAIIRGMVAGGFRGSDIVAYDTDSAKLIRLFEDCGICMTTSAAETAEQVDALVLAVKPQVLPSVLPALSPVLHRCGTLVISIAAGKSLAWLEEMLGAGLPVVRVMPNIAAKVGESMSAFCGNAQAAESHKGIVIGKGGAMLKKIGSEARREIEQMMDTKVNLQLWVKVRREWRDSELYMKNYGYNVKDL